MQIIMVEASVSYLRQRVNALLNEKRYKESSIKSFNHTCDQVQKFMDNKAIVLYSRQAGDTFLCFRHENKPFMQLTNKQKEKVRHVEILSGFQENNTIPAPHYRYLKIVFEGELGKPFNSFIEEVRTGIKSSSVSIHKVRIAYLYRYMQEESVTVKSLDTLFVLRFVNQLNKRTSAVNHYNIMMSVRLFIRYLCSCELLTDNNAAKWMSLLQLRQVYQPKIPSVYSMEEIESLLGAIDRGNPQGKRDYAMILLASRYGLRVSDIIGLRYCNMDWENNRIALFQQKTGRKVVLPLSEEVGSAVIDYLKYGRPKIDLPYIFITVCVPYKELSTNGIGALIKKYFRIAGVNFSGRKHGPHSLRHSLASNLLKSNETLPVISEILGHANTATTMEYLRIDMNHLRQCALDVPIVPSSFYGNLYGS